MFRLVPAVRSRVVARLAATGVVAVLAAVSDASGRSADLDTAAHVAMLTDAARAGVAQAQFELGERYARGDGVEQDTLEAVLWWIQASRQAHPAAAARLADAIENGEHLPRDPARAQAFRRRAAEWGSADAQWRLAQTVEDPAEALEWLHRAAGAGLPDALHALARRTEEGLQVEADPVRAMTLYRRAAMAGHASAANTLGVLLAEGVTGSPDLSAAFFWFDVAARRDIAAAERNRAAVAERLPRRDQRRLRRQAGRFLEGADAPPGS